MTCLVLLRFSISTGRWGVSVGVKHMFHSYECEQHFLPIDDICDSLSIELDDLNSIFDGIKRAHYFFTTCIAYYTL